MKTPFDESSFSLLRRASAGDSSALNQLFTRHLRSLRRWARGRLPLWARDGVDTEDLVQESLIHSLRHIDTFDARRQGALQAYLRRAVINRIRDQIRRSKRRPTTALDISLLENQPGPDDSTAVPDLQVRYERALSAVTDEERALIVARVEMEYTYNQIALAFRKRTPDAARMAVGRALDKLAAAMRLER